MRKLMVPACLALACFSSAATAAEWRLTFEGTLFNPEISPGQPETLSVVLNITTEDVLSTSPSLYGLGQGYRVTGFSGTRSGVPVTAVLSSSDDFSEEFAAHDGRVSAQRPL